MKEPRGLQKKVVTTQRRNGIVGIQKKVVTTQRRNGLKKGIVGILQTPFKVLVIELNIYL
jgi:hypothetical protein